MSGSVVVFGWKFTKI